MKDLAHNFRHSFDIVDPGLYENDFLPFRVDHMIKFQQKIVVIEKLAWKYMPHLN